MGVLASQQQPLQAAGQLREPEAVGVVADRGPGVQQAAGGTSKDEAAVVDTAFEALVARLPATCEVPPVFLCPITQVGRGRGRVWKGHRGHASAGEGSLGGGHVRFVRYECCAMKDWLCISRHCCSNWCVPAARAVGWQAGCW